ncbi:hypothetical protein [Halosimplex pelagicum]|uniref:Uncharacterized protein n=1 Tax=Halosimplex pelagicum TaxID=869886 RepID=A0A7D5PAI3_9EURY|nr:hypothetical protein [Halosimplex pelagicum]QLH84786.1 hypothetical protein HZS54_25455 [Halosimplex pelagicum]
MDGDGTVNPVDNGNIEARMEEGDETAEVSTLKSMGYIDDETEVAREAESTTSGAASTLQTVVILAIVAFFLFGVLYLLGDTVLSVLGI